MLGGQRLHRPASGMGEPGFIDFKTRFKKKKTRQNDVDIRDSLALVELPKKKVAYVPSIHPLWTLCLLAELGSQRLVTVGEQNIRDSLFRKEGKVSHLLHTVNFSLTNTHREG